MVEFTSRIASVEKPDEQQGGLGYPLVILVGAVALAVLWTVVEHVLWSMPVLPNKAPELDAYALLRSALAMLLSLAVVAAFAARTPVATGKPLSFPQTTAVALSLGFLCVFLVMFLLSPAAFYQTSLEDGPVEWPSAILPLAG